MNVWDVLQLGTVLPAMVSIVFTLTAACYGPNDDSAAVVRVISQVLTHPALQALNILWRASGVDTSCHHHVCA